MKYNDSGQYTCDTTFDYYILFGSLPLIKIINAE